MSAPTIDGEGIEKARRRSLIAAYCPELYHAICVTEKGPQRSDEQFTVDIPEGYSGKSFELYLAFISADGEEASDSVYLGHLEV